MLTFFSGFGLGTILTPVFILFFPPEIAVAATALVHAMNNVFKISLIGKHVNRNALVRFGLPAIVGAFGGAFILSFVAEADQKVRFISFETSLLNLLIGSLIMLFAIIELLPGLKKTQFAPKWLTIGGFASGFFGGLSGHQGALRSAFLIRFNLTKEQFVATGVGVAIAVDFIRISTYLFSFDLSRLTGSWEIIAFATLSAFGGAFIGKRLLTKLTIDFIQNLVGILMIGLAVLLIIGKI